MKGDLYRRWLLEGRDSTLEEFVAHQRAVLRQQRAQRRLAAYYGPLMQQATPEMWQTLQQQRAGMMQQAPLGMYRGPALGGIGGLLSGLFQ